MKIIPYLIISSTIAPSLAFAANWEYDPDLPDENTKEELSLDYPNYSIDTTGGVLTVTGNVRNYSGNIYVTGEHDFVVGGGFSTLYGTTTFTDANLNVENKITGQYNCTMNRKTHV